MLVSQGVLPSAPEGPPPPSNIWIMLKSDFYVEMRKPFKNYLEILSVFGPLNPLKKNSVKNLLARGGGPFFGPKNGRLVGKTSGGKYLWQTPFGTVSLKPAKEISTFLF